MNHPEENPETLLRLLPAFRTTHFSRIDGWKDLIVDAGLDLWSLGQRHGVTIVCTGAMADKGFLDLVCECPPQLDAEVEAIKIGLAEATAKRCQACGKPATPTTNGRGEVRTRCPKCLAEARRNLPTRPGPRPSKT